MDLANCIEKIRVDEKFTDKDIYIAGELNAGFIIPWVV